MSCSTSLNSVPNVSAKVGQQIDYYFSDFNLNKDKYLRDLLKSSPDGTISVDQLLRFNTLNQMVGGDKFTLVSILSSYSFNFAKFLPDTESICRNPQIPFRYDRHFLKNLKDHIVYIGKLPENTIIGDIVTWANMYDTCSVQAIKRDKPNIHSALIVFKQKETVYKLLEQSKIGLKFIGEKHSQDYDLQLLPYDEYIKRKNKIRKQVHKTKLAAEFGNLSIDEQNNTWSSSSQSSPKRNCGLKHLVAKRTLMLKDFGQQFDFNVLKAALNKHGVLYIYTIDDSNDYYLLFKNRTALLHFYKELNEKCHYDLAVMLTNNNNSENNINYSIGTDHFTVINEFDLPGNFKNYVKRVKAFFRKKSNLSG